MSTEDSIRKFLLDYCTAFRPGNIVAVAEFYNVPLTMISDGRVAVVDDRSKIISIFNATMADLAGKGFDHSRVDNCAVHPLTDNTALISATFSRLKSDGSILERLGATYTVINDGDNYKIATLIAHAPQALIN